MHTLLSIAILVFSAATASAEEIVVITSGALTAAYLQLSDRYARTAGDRFVTAATLMGSGEPATGFQQLSELRPISGIEIVGLLPPEVQQVTVFSAGITAS